MDADLWRVYELDAQWHGIVKMRTALVTLFAKVDKVVEMIWSSSIMCAVPR